MVEIGIMIEIGRIAVLLLTGFILGWIIGTAKTIKSEEEKLK
ncbi:hypothetical protein LCGC14_0729890 [marine sediment metagenome]|uniref:Uncharacterized protein n=1 Tax=marine sediment metagenome TaxID=412755 RepID=A0A0F9TH64_9ZZZZ